MEQIRFSRVTSYPFIKPKPGTLAPDAVTTPDILNFHGENLLFLGSVSSNRERIIYQRLSAALLNSSKSIFISHSAKIAIEPGAYPYESLHVFDPATIVLNNRILLFYSAVGSQEDSIGLAVSDNNLNFNKSEYPLLNGRSPEIILHEDKLHLFFVRKKLPYGYQIHTAILSITAEVEETIDNPVLESGTKGSWDHFEVTTPRIFERHGIFYMTYAGSAASDRTDLPVGFGLARSFDLLRWEKYPYNPIFELGNSGNWDDGALWFGTVFEYSGQLLLLYEGIGLKDISEPAQQHSQVGLAKIGCYEFDQLVASWR